MSFVVVALALVFATAAFPSISGELKHHVAGLPNSDSCGLPPVLDNGDARLAGSADQRFRRSKTEVAKPYRIVCRFHVIRSNIGESSFDLPRIDTMMRDLNVGFRDTPFVFVREPDVVYIDRDEWDGGFPTFNSMIPMLEEYYEEGVFNWFVVSSVRGGAFPASVWYGPPFTSGERGILMDASLMGQPTNMVTPPHEFGHAVGLLHPYEDFYGLECTSGSNCETAGDQVCDTPASTAIFGGNTTGTGYYFANEPGPCEGDPPYNPETRLYMGAGWPAGHILRDRFTPGQIAAMDLYLNRDQSDLIGPLAPEVLVDCDDDGIDDIDAILDALVVDKNRDMVPDRCQVFPSPGDIIVVGMTADLSNRPRYFESVGGEQRGEIWNGLPWTHRLRLGPDGLVYVPTLTMVTRLDLATGRTHDIVVDGVLEGARLSVDVAFDDHFGLLVLDNNDAKIRRFDRHTGAYDRVFADLSAIGMTLPKSMVRGPGGDYLVVGNGGLGDSIQRIDAETGSILAPLVANGTGILQAGHGLLLDGGELLVSDGGRSAVVVFDATTGDFLGELVKPGEGGLSGPEDLAIDRDGALLVASRGTHSVKRFDRATGEFLGDAVAARAGGLEAAAGLLVVPEPGPTLRRATVRIRPNNAP